MSSSYGHEDYASNGREDYAEDADSDNDSTSAASAGNNDAPAVPGNDSTSAASDGNNDAPAVPGDGTCPCKEHYKDSGNSKKALYLMSIGVTHNNAPLLSFDLAPWSLLPKTSMRPKNTDLAIEIHRRATLYNILPSPRPRNWSRKATFEWLEQNPVRDDRDIEFLRLEVSSVRDVLERAQNARTPNTGDAGRGMWRGAVPYLRVILALTKDHVKHLFLTRARVRTRQEIDARNSDTR